jgi:hypothetical protein
METVRDTINSALEKLNITGGAPQGTPAKEPSEEKLNELKSKYQKAGQEQVFVRPPCHCGDVLEYLAASFEHRMDLQISTELET